MKLCFNEPALLRLSGNVSHKCHIAWLDYHKNKVQKISFGVNAATLLTTFNSFRETTITRKNKDIVFYSEYYTRAHVLWTTGLVFHVQRDVHLPLPAKQGMVLL